MSANPEKCTKCKHEMYVVCMRPAEIHPTYGRMSEMRPFEPETCNCYEPYTLIEKIKIWVRKLKWKIQKLLGIKRKPF